MTATTDADDTTPPPAVVGQPAPASGWQTIRRVAPYLWPPG